jgi:hypothetical protein
VEGGVVGQHDQGAFPARNQSAQKPDIPFPVESMQNRGRQSNRFYH